MSLMLTQDELKKILHYDPATGIFTWRERTSIRVIPGMRAGYDRGGRGYIWIKVGGRHYPAHRLAWFYVHGRWPTHEIDHINAVRDDNRITNLREATRRQNHQNRRIGPSNKSGIKGVSWEKSRGMWRAAVRRPDGSIFHKRFRNKEAAAAFYRDQATRFYGEFARFE